MQITEKTLISELLDMQEDMTEVLLRHGLCCAGCPGSYTETLEDAAEGHGVNVKELISDLNESLKGN